MSWNPEQPKDFAFDDAHMAEAKKHIAKYPEARKQSAVMPLLDLAQRQNGGWLPKVAIDRVAEMLDMAPVRVMEVATFYTMYNLKPVGKNFVQCCTTTPCWLRGSDDIVAACKEELGIGMGETTADGEFTLVEVECQGACSNAPMVMINDDFYEDLDADSMKAILKALKAGEQPKTGPQNGRQYSAPIGGPQTLNGAVEAGE